MDTTKQLSYLEWLSLSQLYQHRDLASSAARYVGLDATIHALIAHRPPLVAWVGQKSDRQVHITAEGIAFYEQTMSSD